MKHAPWIVTALVAALAGPLRAAEPAGAPPATSTPAAVHQTAASAGDSIVPDRKFVFTLSQEDVPVEFKPGLLERRFVVRFALVFKFSDWRSSGEEFPDATKDVKELLFFGPLQALEKPMIDLVVMRHQTSALADRVPQKRLPPAGVLADLKAQLAESRHSIQMQRPMPGLLRVSVDLMATSPQQAEALARAMLTLFDYGWLEPAYPRVTAASAYADGWVRESREKLEKDSRELPALQKELGEMREYAVGSSPNLGSQIQMIAVDAAGVKARIEACNKILQRKDLSPSRIDQVETVKTAAEIELVGLAAKEDALKSLRKTTARHRSLSIRSSSLEREIQRLKELVPLAEEKRTALHAAIEPKTFFGQVVSFSPENGKEIPGKILIHKIKWIEPKPVPGDPQPPQR